MINNRVIGGTLIVAGTCIGAGMLALPVTTAPTGFLLSLFILCCAWFFMLITGLYVLEVNLCLPKGNNYVSMTQETLGKQAAFITWALFVLLLYSLLAAYVTSGGELTEQLLQGAFGKDIPAWIGPLVWTAAFSLLIFFGVKPADYCNRVFMVGLVITYSFVVVLGIKHIDIRHYQPGSAVTLFAAFPIIFTSFGYQIVVPSMSEYLDFDANKTRKVITYGSLLPLLVYGLWEAIIFGTIPAHGEHSLTSILHSGQATKALITVLREVYGSSFIAGAINGFVFFAIASSFLGVSLGLFDFIADSTHLAKDHRSRWMLIGLTFIPPLIYAEVYPHGFIMALSYAGIFVAILHGILPVIMAWANRYQRQDFVYRIGGGKILLSLTLLFFVLVILFDIGTMAGWLPGLQI